MKREKDSVRLKEGQAGGGGRIALITSARAQRHWTNYSPHLSFHARSAFPISLPSSAGSKVSLEPTTLELVPGISSLQGTGEASGYGTTVASADSRGNASLMDRHPLMGSYYSELCRRPGLWSTQELVENISKAPLGPSLGQELEESDFCYDLLSHGGSARPLFCMPIK